MGRLREYQEGLLFWFSSVLLLVGGVAWYAGARDAGRLAWLSLTVLGLACSAGWILAALRRRQPSVDVIALLALAGALLVGEPFAGAMITVMLASGQLLEARAAARARRELSLLAERAPRTARRYGGAGVDEIPVEQVAVGDRLIVGSGEIVPVDGRLLVSANLDESALTGEAMPVERHPGDGVRSGVVNAGQLFELLATATAADSTYAGVVRMVEQAQASSAPFVRVADRLAVYFVPITLIMAAGAWLASGDAVRAVAVLVVATPCPLLLAAPIAIMSGLSRAARVGVVVKGGSALERLTAGHVLLLDKTGTLTKGRPELADVVTSGDDWDANELLRLAASLDQVSAHVLASAIVTAGTRRGLALVMPVDVREVAGYGVCGSVDGHLVRLGKVDWIAGEERPQWARSALRRAELDNALSVFISVDGRAAGAFLLDDPVRPDAPRMIRSLRAAGIHRVLLVTGDRADIAETVGRIVGVDTVLSDCDPAAKLAAVETESAIEPTIMVGDGVNDAPALAAAGAGVALASRGATASSEAADVVLTVDRIDALADAILIARRSKHIALQAVIVGMGLSFSAMGLAAFGLLAPAAGAILQEAIDVLAIVIALRATTPGKAHRRALPTADVETALALHVQHDAVQPLVDQIRTVADNLSTQAVDLDPARDLLLRLQTVLLPHEQADERQLLPLIARVLHGADSTAALSRTHAEIEHQIGTLHRLLAGMADDRPAPEDVIELRRLLYGLYAILRLHNAQEDEGAIAIIPAGRPPEPPPSSKDTFRAAQGGGDPSR